MIERLIAVLTEFEELSELTAEQFADILWLTIQQSRYLKTESENSQTSSQTDGTITVSKISTRETISPTSTPAPTQDKKSEETAKTSNASAVRADIYPKTARSINQESTELGTLSIRVADAPSLRQEIQIARALKSLMRRVPSFFDTVLDEIATIERIGETNIWIPVQKPALELWLEVALVVDEGASMVIWKDTIAQLRQLLERVGIFRDVRTWGLLTNQEGKVQIRPEIGSAARNRYCSPKELVDPNRRRLVLVLSDCESPMWRTRAIIDALSIWANSGSMAIVQMLPKWLWARTALGLASSVQLSGLAPGVTNQQLIFKQLSVWDDIDDKYIKIPVFLLESESIAIWSQMVAGMGRVWTSGVAFQPDFGILNEEEDDDELSAKERFQRFRLTASPKARRLASLIAVAPIITLPVIRLVQETMLSQSSQVHVAEVLLGGLVRLKPEIKVAPDTNPNEVEYQFIDGVNEILLDSLPTTDKDIVKFKLLEQLTQHIADRLGLSTDTFACFLREPRQIGSGLTQPNPIAKLAVEKLKQLGGEYARFAEQLEGQFVSSKKPPASDLQPFEFEVATIELKQSGWFKEKTELVIKRRRQQAQCFIENLGNGVQLEMVAIPEGSFVMGSPENESKRNASEIPQHTVTIKSFFLGKYPVTQAQWQVVAALPQVNRKLNPDPSRFKGANRPVESVSWYDTIEFCDRLSQYTGKTYRLPSEAEWEYACRAGTTTPFHFGETITSDLANYNSEYTDGVSVKGTYREKTTPVGSFKAANAFGLYDMHGNVREWCADHWHDNYQGAPTDGSAWLDKNDHGDRLLRGGSWVVNPAYCRCAYRDRGSPDNAFNTFGFRLVWVAQR